MQFASLYVGDLHPDVNEAQLYAAFNVVGSVASCRVCRDGATRRSLCYGYVNYYSVEHAERAIDTLNYSQIRGKPCRIMWSQRDPAYRKNVTGNIFVKNLDATIDNKALHDTFNMFGTILSCKVAVDNQGKSKGYGFVHYEAEESAKTAIEKVNGMKIGENTVFVGPFIKREEMEKPDEKAFTNLYVKHIPADWEENKLNEVFSGFGEVSSSVIMANEQGKRFALVNYRDAAHAKAAVEALHRKDFRSEEQKAEDIAKAAKAKAEKVDAKAAKAKAGEAAKEEKAEGDDNGEPPAEKTGEFEEKEEPAKAEDEQEQKEDEEADAQGDGKDKVQEHLLFVCRAQTRAERKAELEKEREKRKTVAKERPAGVRLCIRYLSEDTTQESLRELFQPFGKVLAVVVRTDEESGKCRGVGFVIFSTTEEATAAVSEMHLKVVNGTPLSVGLADRRRNRGGEKGDDGDEDVPVVSTKKGEGKGKGKGNKEGKKGGRQKGKGKGNDPPPFPASMSPLPAFGFGPRPPLPGFPGAPPMPGGIAGMPPPLRGPMPGFPGAFPGMVPPRPGTYSLPPAVAVGQAHMAAGVPGQPGMPAFPAWPGAYRHPMVAAMPQHFMAPQMPSPLMMGGPQVAAMVGTAPAAGASMPGPASSPATASAAPAAAASQGLPPLTREAMKALSAQQQKQQLGERLFPLIARHRAEQAGKITGMMLELDNDVLLDLLGNDRQLKGKIEEAMTVLDGLKASS